MIVEKEDNKNNKLRNVSVTAYRDLGHCIGSNAAAVDVKDGKIIRIRPLHYDLKYDPEIFNPGEAWKLKARGKTFKPFMKTTLPPFSLAYKKRVYSPNRIKYPLKRVDWNPNGDRNPQNRGKSKFERISWEEAANIIAGEITRIRVKYGGSAIYQVGAGHGEQKTIHERGTNARLLDLLGKDGYYTPGTRNPDSWEGWFWGGKHFWGCEPVGKMAPQTNVIIDAAHNTEMIIYWSGDPETTTWGWTGQINSRILYWWKELGIKQIYISPDLNYAAAVHADKWIPVLPNTDAAFQLAIAYIWITEETYDKEYIATHSIGFDKFKDYVIGKEDGIPKTPKWASPLCGVPTWTIKAVAREWAKKVTSTAHSNGGSMVRAAFATEPGRLEPMLLAMQGVGKPGVHQISHIEWGIIPDGYPLPKAAVTPNLKGAKFASLTRMPPQALARLMVPTAILGNYTPENPISWYGEGYGYSGVREKQFEKMSYPIRKEDGGSELHMIWTQCPNFTASWNCGNKWIEAYRSPKLECIVSQNIWLEDDTIYSDIILPASTTFECEDIGMDLLSGQFHTVYIQKKCIEPVGESMSDMEGVGEVAKKLGVYEKYSGDKTVWERIEKGFRDSCIADRISWEEFKDNQYYVVPVDPNWEKDWKEEGAGLFQFYKDPKNNPLTTPSGLLEFESLGLKQHFPDDKERPPVPHWIDSSEEHDERVYGERGKNYPLLIVSNHPRWRVHSQHDDISWLREIPTCKVKGFDGYLYEPVWLHPKTAAGRGIVSGDIVKVFNERGAVLGGAYVTERIMPGVAYQDHGARIDEIIPGQLDRGGSNNLICPLNTTSRNATGEVTSGYLVEVERVTEKQMDVWRKQYPDAFERPYDPASGLVFNAWVEGCTD
jgi:molybdopterin guanine dinucleotide-containing S/N-oxide reductase-like protein